MKKYGNPRSRIVEALSVHKEDYCALGPKVIRGLHRQNGRWVPLAQADAQIRIVVYGTLPAPWKKAR